ncbi:hypothetical protein U0070_008001 [Myodes glareolus]|uniref:Uncharacterized protein n=1 Tax=Myodes glareolus TaxID=447135 RepID=A0AAW0HHC1_MYOGA
MKIWRALETRIRQALVQKAYFANGNANANGVGHAHRLTEATEMKQGRGALQDIPEVMNVEEVFLGEFGRGQAVEQGNDKEPRPSSEVGTALPHVTVYYTGLHDLFLIPVSLYFIVQPYSGPTSVLSRLPSCVRVYSFFHNSKVQYFQVRLRLGLLSSVVLPASPNNLLLLAATRLVSGMQEWVSLIHHLPPSARVPEHLFIRHSIFMRVEETRQRLEGLAISQPQIADR